MRGSRRPRAGAVTLERDRERHSIARFRQAVAAGIVYLPRDRRSTGIFPHALGARQFFNRDAGPGHDLHFGLINRRRRRAALQPLSGEAFDRRARWLDAPIATLSGGNQQKVLLARALSLDPRVLLLNDPTRGVDVATRQTLYGVFRDLACGGMALVILSSEIEEVLLLSDRVLVFRDHALAGRLEGSAMRSDAVIAAMFGRAA